MGSCIYFMGVEILRKEFMVQEKISSFVWDIDFQFRLAEFKRRVIKSVEALKLGEEPSEGPRCIIL